MDIKKASYSDVLRFGKEEDFYQKLNLENKTISDLLHSESEDELLLRASIGQKALRCLVQPETLGCVVPKSHPAREGRLDAAGR